MRRLTRACERFLARETGLGLVAVVVVAVLFVKLETWRCALAAGFSRPGELILNYGLLLLLGAAYTLWTVLRVRGRIGAWGEPGFVLAGLGLWARFYCHFLLYSVSDTYGEYSVAEETGDDRLRLLVAVHRCGGLVAYGGGLLLVAWGSRLSRGRAGTPPRGRPRGAPPGKPPAAASPPSGPR